MAYISDGKVIGLSKMNRIVEYFAKRPQVQERLTMQVVQAMQEALGTDRCSLRYRRKTFMCKLKRYKRY